VSTALLDVNVLLALLWPSHAFHPAARGWFTRNRSAGWATSPLTQAGFVRLHSQPVVTEFSVSVRKSIELLSANCSDPNHVFWPHEHALADLLPEIRTRLFGHQQLTDAILLDLAIRRGGRLVTLDRRVTNLLPPESPYLANLEVISQE
jgi:toxin-antitoxin system PIN domain toxin